MNSIIGHGVDLVSVDRMQSICSKWGDRFIQRVFTHSEFEYCSRKSKPHVHYASRFAAKEAMFKALGTGVSQSVRFSDINVHSMASGMPKIELSGTTEKLSRAKGIKHIYLSLSDERSYAIASVIATV